MHATSDAADRVAPARPRAEGNPRYNPAGSSIRGKIKKPKAGLILDSAIAIMRGGDNGAVVVPGKPDQSDLFVLTTHDPDDDDGLVLV